ncbi:MAG: hypothetical protein QG641_2634, partial [Candidatus Poribacteria bacterium]|nr:hypothetical protein [Candidatus Poribacteria bacterium]
KDKLAVTWGKIKQNSLYQNYPNPFNPETWIPYQLAEPTDVNIYIYTESGQLVRKLGLGLKEAGSYLERSKAGYWDGKNEAGEPVRSGIYFYAIDANVFSDTKKMLIIR